MANLWQQTVRQEITVQPAAANQVFYLSEFLKAEVDKPLLFYLSEVLRTAKK